MLENRMRKMALLIALLVTLLLAAHFTLFAQTILNPDARVEEIVNGIEQPEGPVWREGLGLLFSDIQGNKIYRWTPEDGLEVYLDPSYNTNGLTFDLNGLLVAGQMGLRRVVRFEEDGTQTSLAERYDGKRFNSPNDIVVKSDGSIFFTDPDFNIPGGIQNKELSFNGVYRIGPTGNLQLLTHSLQLPNGICFSPDETRLYVNDSQVHKIYVWDVVDDSLIIDKRLFYTIPVNFGYADGMKTDENGNIYATCSSHVWVISSTGELIGTIDLPSNVSASNCAWGEADNKTLFITAGHSVYRVRPLANSIVDPNSSVETNFRLKQNYPNPFNPETSIGFNLPQATQIMLVVYDLAGNKIKTLVKQKFSAGNHSVKWDGTNESGQPVSSGVYLYRMTTGDSPVKILSRKMVLVR